MLDHLLERVHVFQEHAAETDAVYPAGHSCVEEIRVYHAELDRAGHGRITTEIAEAGPFFYAEGYHQQYLAANPNGYCGLGGTGVSCPIGVASTKPRAG